MGTSSPRLWKPDTSCIECINALFSGYHRPSFRFDARDHTHRGQQPQHERFLRHLKRKAGLAEDYWMPDIQVQRYTTEAF